MKLAIKKRPLINIFFIICFLLNSGYCYVLKSDFYTLASLFIFGCVIMGYYGVLRKKFLNREFLSHPFTLLAIFVLLSMFLHFELNIFGTYFRQIFVLLIAVLIAQNISFNRFSKVFINFMFIVTLISIVAWILINVFSINLHLPVFDSGWEKSLFTEYQNGLLFFVHTHQPYKLMGPFWEPGLYSSMAVLAFLFLNNKNYTKNKVKLIQLVLTLGIILSFSTAGYLLLLIAILIKILMNSEKKISLFLFFVILIFLSVSVIYSDEILNYLAKIMPNVFGKMVNGSVSKSTRMNGPLVDLSIYINNPVFGTGYIKYLNEWPYIANLLAVESRTSTITYFIAVFGVFGFLYLFTIIKGVLCQQEINGYVKIFILFIIVSIVTKEPHYVNLFTITICSYLAQEKTIFKKNYNM